MFKYSAGKVLIAVIVFVMGLGLLTGCAEMEQAAKHGQSSWSGLNRQVILYADNGSIIKQWEGKYKIETEDSVFRFIHEGKAVTMMGTVLIEEL